MIRLKLKAKDSYPKSQTKEDMDVKVVERVEAEKVLLLSPHQDDEVFGCGALVKHLTLQGAHVKTLYFSDGAMGNHDTKRDEQLIAEREQEAFQALQVLGVAEVNFLRLKDGSIRNIESTRQRVYEELKTADYDLVLAPSEADWNKDHQAVSRIFKDAMTKVRGKKRPQEWFYTVWGVVEPDILFVADGEYRYKLEAAKKHKSQLKVKHYDDAVAARDQYLAKMFGVGKYAEGYRVK